MAILLPTTRRTRTDQPLFSGAELLQGVQTSDVLSVGVMEGFGGATSGLANVESFLIEKDTGREQNIIGYGLGAAIYYTGNFVESILGGGTTEYDRKPLSKDEWLKSEFYRPDLEYKDGLTVQSARVMSNVYDREQRKNFILSQASGWQNAGFYSTSILSSLADPKSVLGGVAAAGAVRGGLAVYSGARAVAGSGAIGTATKAALAGKTGRAAIAAGSGIAKGNAAAIKSLQGFQYTKKAIAAEAAIGTAIMGATGFEAERVLGREYGVEDFAVDFFASIGMSVGLHVVGGYIGKAWLKTSSANDIDVVAGIVETQVQSGNKVDVLPAVEAQMAERYVPLSTLTPENRKPDVVQVGKKKLYEASYRNEEGIYAVVKGKGATPEEAIADLKRIYEAGEVAAGEYNSVYTAEYYQEALRVQSINDQVASFDIDKEIDAVFTAETGETLAQANKRIKDLEEEVENISATRGENKAKRAEQKLQKEIEKVEAAQKQAAAKTSSRFAELKRLQQDSQNSLVQMQRDLAAPNFVGWVNNQLSDNPVDRAAGVDALNPQKYDDLANQAKEGDPYKASSETAAEIESLKTMSQDKNIPADMKKIIDNQIKEVETSKKIYQAYQSYLLCKAR